MNKKYFILFPENVLGKLNGIQKLKIYKNNNIRIPSKYYSVLKNCQSVFISDSSKFEKVQQRSLVGEIQTNPEEQFFLQNKMHLIYSH